MKEDGACENLEHDGDLLGLLRRMKYEVSLVEGGDFVASKTIEGIEVKISRDGRYYSISFGGDGTIERGTANLFSCGRVSAVIFMAYDRLRRLRETFSVSDWHVERMAGSLSYEMMEIMHCMMGVWE